MSSNTHKTNRVNTKTVPVNILILLSPQPNRQMLSTPELKCQTRFVTVPNPKRPVSVIPMVSQNGRLLGLLLTRLSARPKLVSTLISTNTPDPVFALVLAPNAPLPGLPAHSLLFLNRPK